jgi:hypothetical protein
MKGIQCSKLTIARSIPLDTYDFISELRSNKERIKNISFSRDFYDSHALTIENTDANLDKLQEALIIFKAEALIPGNFCGLYTVYENLKS